MTTLPLAVQLYTLRNETAKDFAGTLKKVAEIGYKGVELAGYGNLKSAADARKALDDAGLVVCAAHTVIEQLESDLDRVLDDARVLKHKTIVCPWMPEERRQNADGWKQAAASLTKIGQTCQQRGFTFCYHHHSFEFTRFGGKSGMDILLENADPQAVKLELDTYWLAHGGEDPVAFIRRTAGRVAMLHVKDMADGAERRFAPVGEGTLKFGPILQAAAKAQVQWAIVEQDNCYDTPPLEAVKTSFRNLRKIDA
jgi:sugar phosphate isomerase/epimerase